MRNAEWRVRNDLWANREQLMGFDFSPPRSFRTPHSALPTYQRTPSRGSGSAEPREGESDIRVSVGRHTTTVENGFRLTGLAMRPERMHCTHTHRRTVSPL
jgi:hypothetical protein